MLILLLIKRVFLSGLLIFLGVIVLKNVANLLKWFGLEELAENIVGGGSVYMWQIIGIGLVIIGILTLGGLLDQVLQ